jgi:hypothetical protein
MSDQRQSSSSSTTAQLSAKMMEAQVYFQKVVKHELQVLVASGLEREVAVRMLLRRIVQSTYEPEESDVKRVMRQFQMIHDDAVRALIVKQVRQISVGGIECQERTEVDATIVGIVHRKLVG